MECQRCWCWKFFFIIYSKSSIFVVWWSPTLITSPSETNVESTYTKQFFSYLSYRINYLFSIFVLPPNFVIVCFVFIVLSLLEAFLFCCSWKQVTDDIKSSLCITCTKKKLCWQDVRNTFVVKYRFSIFGVYREQSFSLIFEQTQ